MARSPAVASPATGCCVLLPPLRRRPSSSPFSFYIPSPPRASIKASSSSSSSSSAPPQGYRGPRPQKDLVGDWLSNNDPLVRSLPIYVGGLSLLAVLLNRTLSGIAPVVDASSSQSRADLLTLSLAVTNILAGLVWLSIQPKNISPRTRGGPSYDWAVLGALQQRYLANLSLYPGRSQLPFLPNDTQAVILQPLGDRGIAIIGGDTIRGFTNLDQAWISLFAEKLDSTLSKS